MPELNATDLRILETLQQDASLTTQEVADRVNMSQSPCWRRINRLEEQGYIDGKVSLLNRDKLGMEVVVFATVNLTTQGRGYLEIFEKEVKVLEEVMECYTMAGLWDYMLKIVARDIRHYERFVRDLPTTPFDAGSRLRFVLYLALPLGSWLGGALVERAIGLLLD